MNYRKSRTVQIRVHEDLKKELKKLASEDVNCSIVMASRKAARFLHENNQKFRGDSRWSKSLPF